MDLVLDRNALEDAATRLRQRSGELRDLVNNTINSLSDLRRDWDTDAGKQFFIAFERELTSKMTDYSVVFQHMSTNLTRAVNMYREVFTAAERVASTNL